MQALNPSDYFALPAPPPIVDVRSPAEFSAGHVTGALSLPLFDDAERAEVGTLYKQDSPDAAMLRGLELAGRKMRALVERAREMVPDGQAVVQCWRGGQRSASVGWLLERAGMEVKQLTGGYKAYRAYAREWLSQPHHRLNVLGGATGSGKTVVLHALRDTGVRIVDLEGLAHHRGSSFGALGQQEQPTTEEFENRLFAALRAIPAGERVWLEDESRMIGTVCQPTVFYDRLVSAPLVRLEVPLERRIQNLVADYSGFALDELSAAFSRLRKRLGGEHLATALEALERRDYVTAAGIALVYYDKAYAHHLERSGRSAIAIPVVLDESAAVTARKILDRCPA